MDVRKASADNIVVLDKILNDVTSILKVAAYANYRDSYKNLL